jgi:hypothetical protein
MVNVNGITPQGKRLTPELQKKIIAHEQANARENGTLSPIKDQVVGIKETPSDEMLRRKHRGQEALSVIARRALVGMAKLRDSQEVAVFDDSPIPPGEFTIVPLSLLKNSDGLASLLTADLSTDVLYQADLTIGNVSTTVPVSPALSIMNQARYIFIQNKGSDPLYFCFDGVYDAGTKTLSKNTTPASGVGQLIQGSGSANNAHLMKANPRLISPTGDQVVNIVITR